MQSVGSLTSSGRQTFIKQTMKRKRNGVMNPDRSPTFEPDPNSLFKELYLPNKTRFQFVHPKPSSLR